MNMNKSLVLLALLVVFGLSGCETMKGVGKDLGTLGDKIESAAKK